ncbi:hypothetical protein pb186bvf_013026 [Paramecium bursaria]
MQKHVQIYTPIFLKFQNNSVIILIFGKRNNKVLLATNIYIIYLNEFEYMDKKSRTLNFIQKKALFQANIVAKQL